MKHVIDQLVTLPRLIASNLVTATAAVTTAAPRGQEVHWAQLLVWLLTAFAALATGSLALIKAFIEVKKLLKPSDQASDEAEQE